MKVKLSLRVLKPIQLSHNQKSWIFAKTDKLSLIKFSGTQYLYAVFFNDCIMIIPEDIFWNFYINDLFHFLKISTACLFEMNWNTFDSIWQMKVSISSTLCLKTLKANKNSILSKVPIVNYDNSQKSKIVFFWHFIAFFAKIF